MDDAVGRFILFVPVMALCVVLAIGINAAIWATVRLLKEWWAFRRVRRQARAER